MSPLLFIGVEMYWCIEIDQYTMTPINQYSVGAVLRLLLMRYLNHFLLSAALLVGCAETAVPTAELVLPTTAAIADVPELPTAIPATATVPPTFTPVGMDLVVATPLGDFAPTTAATYTPFPTATPSNTPTITPSPTPTETPIPIPTDTPTAVPPPASGNYLPNASFEEGWYHLNGRPELQIPNQWLFEWDEGPNTLDPDPWNAFVRPEVRVLSTDFLPAQEHATFIWNGEQTVKVFKGEGAISYRLLTDVELEPGTYLFSIKIYPDLVMGYTPSGAKIWADDVLAGEVRLIADGRSEPWMLPNFGQRNVFTVTFTITEKRPVRIGVAVRGRWAILNNGWFMDDWSLQKVD